MISESQLETVLEAWRLEYGYGECAELAADDIASVGFSSRKVAVGTLADEFNDAWNKLCGGTTPEWRMAMSLKADVFASPGDPMELILSRLRSIGIAMAEKEFADHARWARSYFRATLTITRAA